MFVKVAFAAAAASASLISATALAQGRQDFTLTNRTGYSISEVYVAPSSSEEWEEDVMGRDVLNNGETVEISFPPRERTCIYDIAVVFDDGGEADWRKFNLCEISRVTLFYNRRTNETTAEYE
jgi:hypothetical protein